MPHLATCIFLFFYNEPELGVGIESILAWLWHHFHLALDRDQTHHLMIVSECSTARPQLLLNNVPLLEWGGDQGFCDDSTRARGKRHDNGKGSFKIVTSLRNHSLGLQHWLSNLLWYWLYFSFKVNPAKLMMKFEKINLVQDNKVLFKKEKNNSIQVKQDRY